ncbi:MAG: Ppx/GppA phosphatase family protein, partial [Phycisphaerales bacterium]
MKRNRCVIDLGSNSVRLRIARQTASGGFETVAEEREMVRLGGNIVSTGSIDPRAVSDTLGVMRRFRSLLARHRIQKVLVFATAAIRDASNGADVALAIQDVLGVPVRVLSTREEGEFLLRGARRRYALDRVHGVIADLGGGSLQVVRIMRGFAVENVSLPIGALRMTGRFGTGKFSVSGYERMSAWVRTQLRGTLRSTMPRCEFLAGAGGGFASSESMAQAVG